MCSHGCHCLNRIRGTGMTKAETIEYAIKKECQRFSLVEWCESWDITVEEFYRFLELGRKAFDEGEQE